MSFVQEKLEISVLQTVGIFNKYIYAPNNGDTIADITTAGYFDQSRYIGQDGWESGIIDVLAADGYFTISIGTGGTTGSQSGASASTSSLDPNVRSFVTVKMSSLDYIMTYEESVCAVINVINPAVGKTLYFPTSSDGMRPAICEIITLFAAYPFSIAQETGGVAAELNINSVIAVANLDGLGCYNATTYYNIQARTRINQFITDTTAARLVGSADAGCFIKFTNAAAVTITVDSDNNYGNYTTRVYAEGAAGATIVSDGTSVVTGKTALAAGENATIYRNNGTDNYFCV